MTTDTSRTKAGPRPIDCASTNPALDLESDTDFDETPYPVQRAEIKQVFNFLTFTLREGIQQTVHALTQSLKCTYLLVSVLHRPYLDFVRVLVPLWLAIIHAILLDHYRRHPTASRINWPTGRKLHGMDRPHRSSRLPTPRLPFRKRPVISAPFGPVQHNGRIILPSRPVTTSKISGDYVFGEVVSGGGRKDERHKSARSPTHIIKTLEDSAPRQLSKSRTFNVLSGITASFSRSSLAPSRRTTASSNGSSASLAQVTTADTSLSKAPTSSRLPVSKSGRLSLGSHKADLHLTQNPCCIYTEQPSAYWSGRFNSLHDKFLAECLTPNNLQSLLGAKADHSTAVNQQLQPHLLRETQYTRFNTRLPPSATSAAILEQTGRGGGLNGDTGGKQSLTSYGADVKLLLDDDERCKRVFVHLEAFCATEEARRSLFAFQQDFARKEGRPKLLPRGGTMGDRNWGSYISRMGVKRIGKRASMY